MRMLDLPAATFFYCQSKFSGANARFGLVSVPTALVLIWKISCDLGALIWLGLVWGCVWCFVLSFFCTPYFLYCLLLFWHMTDMIPIYNRCPRHAAMPFSRLYGCQDYPRILPADLLRPERTRRVTSRLQPCLLSFTHCWRALLFKQKSQWVWMLEGGSSPEFSSLFFWLLSLERLQLPWEIISRSLKSVSR